MKLCISVPAVHINYKYPDTKQSMEKHWNMLLHTNINGKCRNIPWSWIRSNNINFLELWRNINFLKLWSFQELACSIDVVLYSVVLKLWAVTCYNNMVLCTKITIKLPYISGFLCYIPCDMLRGNTTWQITICRISTHCSVHHFHPGYPKESTSNRREEYATTVLQTVKELLAKTSAQALPRVSKSFACQPGWEETEDEGEGEGWSTHKIERPEKRIFTAQHAYVY